MTPWLLVTVDTEEEGLWNGTFPTSGWTVQNVQQLPIFQELCDRWGINPTYFVDAAVIQDVSAVSVLRRIAEERGGEIGAHLHPWCNPPLREVHRPRDSFLYNLPTDLQRAKIAWLTERMEQALGCRPRSFRAGRYGLDDVGLRLLIDHDYTVDSSVIPFTDYREYGGPVFAGVPVHPYHVSESLTQQVSEGALLEVPISVGYNWKNFEAAHQVLETLRRSRLLRSLRIEGILHRLRWLQRIKLSPEQATAAQMCTLIDCLLAQGCPAVVLMFHSSSLLPGASPYVRNEHQLQDFLERLEQVFRYCLEQRGLQTGTLQEFAQAFKNTCSKPLMA